MPRNAYGEGKDIGSLTHSKIDKSRQVNVVWIINVANLGQLMLKLFGSFVSFVET